MCFRITYPKELANLKTADNLLKDTKNLYFSGEPSKTSCVLLGGRLKNTNKELLGEIIDNELHYGNFKGLLTDETSQGYLEILRIRYSKSIKNIDKFAKEVEYVLGEELYAKVKSLNPSKSKANCIRCSLTLDDVLKGKAYQVNPKKIERGNTRAFMRFVEKEYQTQFQSKAEAIKDISQVIDDFKDLGDGATGIIVASLKKEELSAHAFNIYVKYNMVYFLDAQVPSGYKRLKDIEYLFDEFYYINTTGR